MPVSGDDLLTGRDGYVILEASTSCAISSWTMTVDQAILRTALKCGGGWTTTGRGNKTITGSLTFKYDSTDPIDSSLLTDSLVTLELHMDATHYWSGEARLGQLGFGANIETSAFQEVTCAFESDGQWTLTSP